MSATVWLHGVNARERSFVVDAAAWKMFGGMRLTNCLRMGYTVFVASGGGVFWLFVHDCGYSFAA